MPGSPVILVRRDRLFTSEAFRALSRRERGAFLTTVCLLMRNDRSALEGCLCVGLSPMGIEEWAREVGETRRSEAQALWDRLFDLGLFEWHEHDGRRYPRVALFALHRPPPRRAGRAADASPPRAARTSDARQPQSTDSAGVDAKGVAEQEDRSAPKIPVNVPLPFPSLRSGSFTVPLKGGAGEPAAVSEVLHQALARVGEALGGNGNGNGALSLEGLNGNGKRNGNGPPLTAGQRRSLVERIETVTGDIHSRANWEHLVDRLAASEEGLDALLGHLCAVEDALTGRDPRAAPLRSPGAVLNARLRAECSRLKTA